MDVKQLEEYIKQKLIKKLKWDPEKGITDIDIQLNDAEFSEIEEEAKKYKITGDKFHKLLQELTSEINLDPKIKEVNRLIPGKLKVGQHLRLITCDERGGRAVEEFIFLSEKVFILTKHERGSLLVGDELHSLTSPWNVGYSIDFEVYRDKKRIERDNDLSVYRTRKIQSIELLNPKFDFNKISE